MKILSLTLLTTISTIALASGGASSEDLNFPSGTVRVTSGISSPNSICPAFEEAIDHYEEALSPVSLPKKVFIDGGVSFFSFLLMQDQEETATSEIDELSSGEAVGRTSKLVHLYSSMMAFATSRSTHKQLYGEEAASSPDISVRDSIDLFKRILDDNPLTPEIERLVQDRLVKKEKDYLKAQIRTALELSDIEKSLGSPARSPVRPSRS